MKPARLIAWAAAAAIAYLIASPYIALHQMKHAVQTRDGEALAEFIDFPSVRESIKEQFRAMVVQKATDEATAGNGFAALGAALAGSMVDGMIDGAVTSANLTKLMDGAERKGVIGAPLDNATARYASWNKFIVTVKPGTPEEGRFILRRSGLAEWNLTEVRLPKAIFENDAASAQADASTDATPAVEPAPVEAAAPAQASRFNPLLAPAGKIPQGRCHMNACGWAKWVNAKMLANTGDELRLGFQILVGTTEHPGDEPNYPTDAQGVAINWEPQVHDVVITCSPSKPSVTWDGDGGDVLQLNPAGTVYGYQEDSALFYFMACHSDPADGGLAAAIEDHHYAVPVEG
jgi:hypothetical protein